MMKFEDLEVWKCRQEMVTGSNRNCRFALSALIKTKKGFLKNN
jgi:hypothetical protein